MSWHTELADLATGGIVSRAGGFAVYQIDVNQGFFDGPSDTAGVTVRLSVDRGRLPSFFALIEALDFVGREARSRLKKEAADA
jgi:hypothetical protein